MSVHQDLIDKYQCYLNEKTGPLLQPPETTYTQAETLHLKRRRICIVGAALHLKRSRICIVGAGMAGLYSALMLNHYGNFDVKIFEASNRIGGCVYTYKFPSKSSEPHQYFEAGAMRFPDLENQRPLLSLIEYLNERTSREHKIDLIPYHYSHEGNLVYVNGTKQRDGKIMSVNYANEKPDQLGFPREAGATVSASKLLDDALKPVINEFKNGTFETALKEYDNMSLHSYLRDLGWHPEKINYVEVMTSQTNSFRLGLVEQVVLNSECMAGDSSDWMTIDKGMCRLPEVAASVVGNEKITLEAQVVSLAEELPDSVKVGYVKDGTIHHEHFDAVILAIPACAVHMIPEKPLWPVNLRHGLRAISYFPLTKIGLRFKSRFWEKGSRPALGGQSTTDLPCRWVVYPSYGIGDPGRGVLVVYSWLTDSNYWLPKSDREKITLVLKYLQELYPDVKIADEYAGGKPDSELYTKEAYTIEWATNGPAGVASFYGGQFTDLYPIMRKPQRNIYFAGEHLSLSHGWIVGTLNSAKSAVEQIIKRELHHL